MDAPNFDARRPFLRRTALAAGITPLIRVRAALLPYADVAWASHASAARVYDLPIPTIAVEHVSVPRAGQRRRHQGVKVHVGGPAARTRVVRGVRVAVEYNGKVHVLTPDAWEADLERRDVIDDTGWRPLPVIGSGIFSTPEKTLIRVHRVLLARGVPGVPARLSDEWRAHFPGHADAA